MAEEERFGRAHDECSYEHLELMPVGHASGNVQLAVGFLCLKFRRRV